MRRTLERFVATLDKHSDAALRQDPDTAAALAPWLAALPPPRAPPAPRARAASTARSASVASSRAPYDDESDDAASPPLSPHREVDEEEDELGL